MLNLTKFGLVDLLLALCASAGLMAFLQASMPLIA
jgi:hypothetical protein